MRKPTTLIPWFSAEELLAWVREAPDKKAYQRRLAVWLTHLGPYHAYEVAEMLGVSKQSVWQWVSQYNKSGPDGLERIGSGGRQWSYLSWEEEKEVLEPFWGKARDGEVITAKSIWPEISKAVGKNVTLDYVYKLLHRHGWRKLGPRPRHVKSNPATQEQFKKNCPTL